MGITSQFSSLEQRRFFVSSNLDARQFFVFCMVSVAESMIIFALLYIASFTRCFVDEVGIKSPKFGHRD